MKGALFDYVTPGIALGLMVLGKDDYYGYVPTGWSGDHVCRVLRQAGCNPRAMWVDPQTAEFLVTVDDRDAAAVALQRAQKPGCAIRSFVVGGILVIVLALFCFFVVATAL